jgi:hypothetical protein
MNEGLIGKGNRVFCQKLLFLEMRMPINETYRTWIQRICELRPKQRKTQVQNFVWLILGMFIVIPYT